LALTSQIWGQEIIIGGQKSLRFPGAGKQAFAGSKAESLKGWN
jgi:hypothetical protein